MDFVLPGLRNLRSCLQVSVAYPLKMPTLRRAVNTFTVFSPSLAVCRFVLLQLYDGCPELKIGKNQSWLWCLQRVPSNFLLM